MSDSKHLPSGVSVRERIVHSPSVAWSNSSRQSQPCILTASQTRSPDRPTVVKHPWSPMIFHTAVSRLKANFTGQTNFWKVRSLWLYHITMFTQQTGNACRWNGTLFFFLALFLSQAYDIYMCMYCGDRLQAGVDFKRFCGCDFASRQWWFVVEHALQQRDC